MSLKIKKTISILINILYLILTATFISLIFVNSKLNVNIFYDFTFLFHIISFIFVLIFLIIQLINKLSIKTYILYYLSTSLSLITSFLFFSVILYKNTFLMNLNNIILNIVSPILLIINFLFFIGKGKYIFLDSIFSLIIPSIYIIVILILSYLKIIDPIYYFFDVNKLNIGYIILNSLIGLIIIYALSSILLMYHNNGQDLTENKFKLSRKSLLLNKIADNNEDSF